MYTAGYSYGYQTKHELSHTGASGCTVQLIMIMNKGHSKLITF